MIHGERTADKSLKMTHKIREKRAPWKIITSARTPGSWNSGSKEFSTSPHTKPSRDEGKDRTAVSGRRSGESHFVVGCYKYCGAKCVFLGISETITM